VSLQTYGFALIDCGYDDPLDSSATTDYLDEVAAFLTLRSSASSAQKSGSTLG